MTRALTARGDRALLVSALGHAAATLLLLLLLAWGLTAWLQLSSLYVLKTAGLFVGSALLFAPLLLRAHPFDHFGAANRITLLRGMLVSLLGGCIGEPVSTPAALAIVALGLVALLLDGLDGSLARRSGLASEFGARFDMETDAALVLLFGILAWQMGKAGVWVVLSGLLRYLFLAAGSLLPWMRTPLPPSKRRQTVCVMQISVMLAVLLPFVASPWSDVLAGLSLALLTASFLADVLWLANHRSADRESIAAPVARHPS